MMNRKHWVFALGMLTLSAAAWADKLRMPAVIAPGFKAECTGCHIAYPPSLLTAGEWQRVMAMLDKHYGDNADLDEKTRQQIENFLVKNARVSKKDDVPVEHQGGELPRLTTAVWFKRKHHEVRRSDWSSPKLKSPSNCAGCHTRAADGSFREREIVMPDGRKWED